MLLNKKNSLRFILLSLLIACQHVAVLPATKDDGGKYEAEAIKYYNLGVKLHQDGLLDEACVQYRAAAQADSRMTEAWHNLGCIYAQKHLYDKAIEAYKKALDSHESPTNRFHDLNDLAGLYCEHGNYEEAEW